MYDMLSPIHWIFGSSVEDTIDRYCSRISKESLCASFRSELWYWNPNLLHKKEARPHSHEFNLALRDARNRSNAVRTIFNKFAIRLSYWSRPVWTQDSFCAFLISRLEVESLDTESPIVRILWRSFCYNAKYPFIYTKSAIQEQHITLEEWVQATLLLSTNAIQNVGWNGTGIELYNRHTERCQWRRFASFATWTDSSEEYSSEITAEDDAWSVPDMLDAVVDVTITQLPLPPKVRLQRFRHIRAKVWRLLQDRSSYANPSVGTFGVPYEELVALVATILHVSTHVVHEQNNGTDLCFMLAAPLDESAEEMAASILAIHDIRDGEMVRFEQFLRLSQSLCDTSINAKKSSWASKSKGLWSFDHEVKFLWHALFCVSEHTLTTRPDATPSIAAVPAQVYEFLVYSRAGAVARQDQWRRTLTLSIGPEEELTRQILLQSLVNTYHGKLLLVSGRTIKSQDAMQSQRSRREQCNATPFTNGETTVFAVMLPSPLWYTRPNGQTVDFELGRYHMLAELLPRQRALRYTDTDKRCIDLVQINDATVSFGDELRGKAGTTAFSGLVLDLENRTAMLESSLLQPQVTSRYVEGLINDRGKQVRQEPKACKTCMQISSLAVYDLHGGVSSNLIQKLGTKVHSRARKRKRAEYEADDD